MKIVTKSDRVQFPEDRIAQYRQAKACVMRDAAGSAEPPDEARSSLWWRNRETVFSEAGRYLRGLTFQEKIRESNFHRRRT